jgi:hypothetical protein
MFNYTWILPNNFPTEKCLMIPPHIHTEILKRIKAAEQEHNVKVVLAIESGSRALKLYPWICGRYTREFTHKNLRELTVHHRATITTTIPPTAATANCYACIATTKNTPNFPTKLFRVAVNRVRLPLQP